MPAGYRRSLFIAAIYPEVAALATVLAAADWHPPAQDDGLGVDHIIVAAERALGGGDALLRPEVSFALLTWLTTRTARAAAQAARDGRSVQERCLRPAVASAHVC